MDRVKAGLALLGSALIIGGVFGIAVRLAKPGFGGVTQNILRLFFAALILFGIVYAMRQFKLPTRKELRLLVGLGLAAACTGMFFTLAATSIKLTTTIAVIYVFSILLATLIDVIFIRKGPLSIGKCVAIALAITGLLVYANPIALFGSLGVLFAVAAGVTDAIGNTLRSIVGRSDSRLHRFAVAMYQCAIGVPIMIAVMLGTGEQAVTAQVGLIPILGVALYIVSSAALAVLLIYGFGHIGSLGVGTVILSTQLLFAALVGALLLHEQIHLREIIALLLLMAASSYGIIDDHIKAGRASKRAEAS